MNFFRFILLLSVCLIVVISETPVQNEEMRFAEKSGYLLQNSAALRLQAKEKKNVAQLIHAMSNQKSMLANQLKNREHANVESALRNLQKNQNLKTLIMQGNQTIPTKNQVQVEKIEVIDNKTEEIKNNTQMVNKIDVNNSSQVNQIKNETQLIKVETTNNTQQQVNPKNESESIIVSDMRMNKISEKKQEDNQKQVEVKQEETDQQNQKVEKKEEKTQDKIEYQVSEEMKQEKIEEAEKVQEKNLNIELQQKNETIAQNQTQISTNVTTQISKINDQQSVNIQKVEINNNSTQQNEQKSNQTNLEIINNETDMIDTNNESNSAELNHYSFGEVQIIHETDIKDLEKIQKDADQTITNETDNIMNEFDDAQLANLKYEDVETVKDKGMEVIITQGLIENNEVKKESEKSTVQQKEKEPFDFEDVEIQKEFVPIITNEDQIVQAEQINESEQNLVENSVENNNDIVFEDVVTVSDMNQEINNDEKVEAQEVENLDIVPFEQGNYEDVTIEKQDDADQQTNEQQPGKQEDEAEQDLTEQLNQEIQSDSAKLQQEFEKNQKKDVTPMGRLKSKFLKSIDNTPLNQILSRVHSLNQYKKETQKGKKAIKILRHTHIKVASPQKNLRSVNKHSLKDDTIIDKDLDDLIQSSD